MAYIIEVFIYNIFHIYAYINIEICIMYKKLKPASLIFFLGWGLFYKYLIRDIGTKVLNFEQTGILRVCLKHDNVDIFLSFIFLTERKTDKLNKLYIIFSIYKLINLPVSICWWMEKEKRTCEGFLLFTFFVFLRVTLCPQGTNLLVFIVSFFTVIFAFVFFFLRQSLTL